MKPLLSFLFCLTVFCTSAFSQTTDSTETSIPPDQEVMVLGGPAYPYLPQDFHDIWKKGWNAGVAYGISYAPGSIGYGAIYASIGFDRFALDEAAYRSWLLDRSALSLSDKKTVQTGSLSARGSVKAVTAMLNFKGAFSSTKQSIAPYFLIGIGYIHYSSDSVSISGASQFSVGGESESGFSWSFGIGVEVPVIDNVALFAEGRSVIGAFQNTRQYFPVSGGIRYRLSH